MGAWPILAVCVAWTALRKYPALMVFGDKSGKDFDKPGTRSQQGCTGLRSWSQLGIVGQARKGHLAGNDCMCTALAVLDNLLQLPHDALPDQQRPCAAQHSPLSVAAEHAFELLLNTTSLVMYQP